MNKNAEKTNGEEKQPNKFLRLLHTVFVYNIGYKLTALVLSAAVFLLTAGLS